MMAEVVKGMDPAIYLLFAVILLAILYFVYSRRSRSDDDDDFFTNLDGEKVSFVGLIENNGEEIGLMERVGDGSSASWMALDSDITTLDPSCH